MEIQEMKEQLIEWVEQMKYGYRDSDLYLHEENDKTIRIRLYTLTNVYFIVATSTGYLGATVSSRKSRAGEDWTRGSDLADGEFSKETWFAILGDIVGHELVKIHRPIRHLYEDGVLD